MRLLLVPASLCLAACTAPSDSVGVAVAYVGPQDKRPPCLAYSTQELMEQTVTEARRSADCIFPDPLPILVDAPAFYRTLDRLPNHEGVAAPEHFETHILFVVVTRAGPVLKRVRLEQGLQALDELGSHASQADRERVRADFIGPVRRMDVTLSAGDADYQRKWALMSSAHDRLMTTVAGRDYEQQLIAVRNTFWQSVYAQCSGDAKKEGVASFRAIAVINENGLLMEFLPLPNSEHFGCFVDGMRRRRYPVPPSAPFYERYTIDLVD